MSLRLASGSSGRRFFGLVLTTVIAGGSVAIAQEVERERGGESRRGGFERGGFGGPPGGFSFGGRGGGVAGTLMNESARVEVGITPDQQAQIDKLNEDRRNSFEQMRNSGVDFRSMSDDERRQFFDKQAQDGEAKLKAVLKPEQYTRLQQIGFHRSGPSSLGRDETLIKEFNVTDQQKEQLEKVRDDERSSQRSTWNLPEEEKAKVRTEFEAKYMAILTPAQQQQWRDKIGPAPKELSGTARPVPFTGGPGLPGGVPGGAPRAPRPEKPVEGPLVMSFNRDAPVPGNLVGESTEKPFSFRFNGAPWDDVLEMFAKKAGLTLDIHDTPPGTFTYFDNKQYTPVEALDVINRHLSDRGYILIRRDNALVCYNYETTQISPNLIPNVTLQELPQRGEHELLSLVIPIDVGDVTQVAKDIDLMKGPQGSVKPLPSTSTIIVTDLGTNLRRIAEMVKGITPPNDNGLIFKPYPLQWILAEDAEPVISQQLGVAQTVANVSSSNGDRGRGGFGFPPFGGFGDRGRDGDRGSSSSSRPPTTTATPTPNARVQAEPRLNHLLVTASPAQHKVVEEVLRVLDVDDGSGTKIQGGRGSNKRYLEVYQLKSADVRDVAKSLDAIMPGVVVNEDGDTDRIHIMATSKQHEQVRQHIALMDGHGAQEVAVIPLAKMDPTQAMSSLRAVFVRDGTSAPTIEPDTYGRQLIVRATPDQLIQIRKVLEGLGEDGTGRRPSQSGSLRAFNLQGRDVDSVMQMTQQMWGPSGKSRIRIVTPQSRGAVNGIRVPSQRPEPEATSTPPEEPRARPARQTTTPGGRASYDNRPGSNVARMMTMLAASESQSLTSAVADQADDEGQQSQPKSAEAPESSSAEPPITITQIGDQLIIQSKDEKALDRLEDILAQSLEYIPPDTKPTIFILQSADPVETANMLVAMFPDLSLNAAGTTTSGGTMSSMFSGVQSFGSDLWSASGMSSMSSGRFQIIPNTRLNALFVYGPPHKVAEVEQMIEVLDATDWPESGRSRRPRMIELKHADVNEVYTIVKDVYSDYLESESSRQNQNPLAALAGGGRGGNNREATPPRMTLGIDRNSSKLIVSASDDLFEQVSNLVDSLDQAALDSQRTVRVVQIKNADAATLQNALQQIVPKVTPANTSSRSSSPGQSSGGGGDRGGDRGGDNNSRGGGDDDARRQQMMQMFGGGGGSPFSGRSGASPFSGGSSRGGFSPFGGGGFSPFGGRSFGGDRGGDRGRR